MLLLLLCLYSCTLYYVILCWSNIMLVIISCCCFPFIFSCLKRLLGISICHHPIPPPNMSFYSLIEERSSVSTMTPNIHSVVTFFIYLCEVKFSIAATLVGPELNLLSTFTNLRAPETSFSVTKSEENSLCFISRINFFFSETDPNIQ